MKWLSTLLVIALLMIALAPAVPVSSAMITVIWRPLYDIQPPWNFTATYVDEYTVDLTWEIGGLSTQTMIRAGIDGYPTEPTDGRLVYLGAAEEFTDESVDLEMHEYVYYRAWGEDSGEYSDDTSDITMVSVIMLTIGLIFVTAAIVGLAFWKEDHFLHIVASMVAIGFGAWWISTNSGFIYIIEGMVVVAIGLYMIFSTAISLMRR